ncbi:MAG: hypothetical protein HY925_12510 [Elusimicrobia bacterium]|nr:hypothetical protein [Elusimicrobiota bacterium]
MRASTEAGPAPRGWKATVVAAALASAFLLLLPDLLIVRVRRFYRERLPDVAKRWEYDGRYTVFTADADVQPYAPRVAEAARKGWPYDAHIAGARSARLDTSDPLPLLFLGWLTRALGGIDAAWLAARAIGGAAWVLVFYWLAMLGSANRRFSLACAVGATLFNDVLDMLQYGVLAFPRELALRVYWILGWHWVPFGVSRVPRPALTYPLLLAALGLAAVWARTGRAAALWAGALIGGALAYVHSDVFFLYAGTMAVWTLWRLGRLRKLEPSLIASGALSLALALPWMLHHLPPDADLLLFYWRTFTRRPDLNGLWAFALAAWCWKRHPKDDAIALVGAALAASGLAMEAHLVTGYTMFHSFHWHNLGLVFAVLALAQTLGRKVPERRDWLWLAAAFMLVSAGRAVSYAAQRAPFQALRSDLQGGLEWLARETPPDSVVVSLHAIDNQLIPTYSHNKTMFSSGFPVISDISVKEDFRRFKRALELFGLPEDEYWKALEAHAGADPNDDLWHLRPSWADFGWRAGPFPNGGQREERLKRYRAMPPLTPAREARADYLWVGPFETELLGAGRVKKLGRPAFQRGEFSIYRLSGGA